MWRRLRQPDLCVKTGRLARRQAWPGTLLGASAGHVVRARSRTGAGPLRDGGHSYRKPPSGEPAQADLGPAGPGGRDCLAFGLRRLGHTWRNVRAFTRRGSHITRRRSDLVSRSSHISLRGRHLTRRSRHMIRRSGDAARSGGSRRPRRGGSTATARLLGSLLRRRLAPGGSASNSGQCATLRVASTGSAPAGRGGSASTSTRVISTLAAGRLSTGSRPIGTNLVGLSARISSACGCLPLAGGRLLVAVGAGPANPDPALSVGCCLTPRIHRADSNE